MHHVHDGSPCCRVPRRTFLADVGMGFTGLALGAMLSGEKSARGDEHAFQAPNGRPHFAPKAKNVIWLFMVGGVSHLESFDPKPALNEYAGKSLDETPYKHFLDPDFLKDKVRTAAPDLRKILPKLYPLQVGHKRYGESGTEVSDWFPHIGGVVDELAVIRSMWTTDIDHGAQLQFHTGRNALDGNFPTLGSWIHYGLGTLNENLPKFVVLGRPLADCCGGNEGHRADYLGPEHDGVPLNADPQNPLPFAAPGRDTYREEQAAEFALLDKLNGLQAVEYPGDAQLRARIRSYELAFRMQMAVPDAVGTDGETAETVKLYGDDKGNLSEFARNCLVSRRLVERGVRFVQVYHGSNGAAGAWDAHSSLKQNHSGLAAQVDKPIAALVQDLKRRGLLDETLVVWGTEFGRSPGAEGSTGRDHHPFGFSIFMAGGGLKKGIVHGATDEIGFAAAEHPHYVTDLHATVLRQLGLDSRKLEIPGRKRLEIDHGEPIDEIIA
ncbi:MAG: DUF1501 domain-containing protein [Planctomycetales bacterium]